MKASKKRVQMTIYLDPEVRDRLEKIQHETYVKTGVYKSFNEIITDWIKENE